jgi:hypothetical protein
MYAEKTANKDKVSNETKAIPVTSRGLGIDYSKGCFVCGHEFVDAQYIEAAKKRLEAHKEIDIKEIERYLEELKTWQLLDNIAVFVDSKEDGEYIVAEMFDNKGARVDFREQEPEWIQVKIGACPEHLENLKKLNGLTSESGTITKKMVDQARNYRIPRR